MSRLFLTPHSVIKRVGLVVVGTALLVGCAIPIIVPVTSESNIVAQDMAIDRGYHVVQKGETLYSIAWSYDVDFRALARWNGIGSDYRIFPGQRLKLSGPKLVVSESESRQKNDENVKTSTVSEAPKARELPNSAPSLPTTVTVVTEKPNTPVSPPSVQRESVTTPQIPPKNSTNLSTPNVDQDWANGKPKWLWPTFGKLLQGFSNSPTGNKGLNLAGKLSDPVRAAAPGRVVYAGSGLRGFGQLVILKHSEDFLSAYAHNNKLLVKEDDVVKSGQVIAEVGKSGTDIEQLHFEIRYQGKPVDPLKYLPKR